MAEQGRSRTRNISLYDHKDKERTNNPPVGLVTPATDPDSGEARTYAYDPHLDPALQWAGKAEHTSFDVPTVSLHVHERIDPRTIIEAVRKRAAEPAAQQLALFQTPAENPPLREAIEFYKHPHNWSNRLIAGDSLLVMNSLLEKEGMAGQVQMVYIDPPYGIRYGSNFQPFVNRRDVRDGKDDDLTQEPEMIRAFRDTWELDIHSYLTYLRDRLLLARELLADSGACFVQISDENLHRVRCLLDEIFGPTNNVATICYKKPGQRASGFLPVLTDFILFYAKNREHLTYRQLYVPKSLSGDGGDHYTQVELPNGLIRPLSTEERLYPSRLPTGSQVFETTALVSAGAQGGDGRLEFQGKAYYPPLHKHWSASLPDGMERLARANRIISGGQTIRFKRYFDDFPYMLVDNRWDDIGIFGENLYVVQTAPSAVERCMLMTTDPGDLVLDPTCGSGTTAYVAEHWGRRWITCDTSRVAITLAKQRLMTAMFDYYELAQPQEGVGSGFRYKTVPHITLKSIANNEPPKPETLYDQPIKDATKVRVTGPFTVEAVPAPTVRPLSDIGADQPADESLARSGETVRQRDWRDELLKTGIRGKAGQRIEFSRVEPMGGTRWLQADAETKGDVSARVVISFGPEYAPLEQRQVSLAIEEAQTLVPRPKFIVFAAFQFDPEAARDIDETNWPGVTLLKVQMNADLLTDDLKKKRASNESFWLIGQPDVEVRQVTIGESKGKWQVEVHGFDYYNTRTGGIEAGDTSKIALWLLDPDYDGRSLYPRQVFFPMADERDGWGRLARNLKAEIDDDLIESYRGTVSLPFELGDYRRIALKIVDDRGIESLKVVEVQ